MWKVILAKKIVNDCTKKKIDIMEPRVDMMMKTGLDNSSLENVGTELDRIETILKKDKNEDEDNIEEDQASSDVEKCVAQIKYCNKV